MPRGGGVPGPLIPRGEVQVLGERGLGERSREGSFPGGPGDFCLLALCSGLRLGCTASPAPQPPVAAAIPELQQKVWLLLQEAAGPSNQRMIMTSEICCSLGNNRVLSLLENCVHQLTLLSY